MVRVPITVGMTFTSASNVRVGAVRPILESMVIHTDRGDLLDRFLSLSCPRMFMYGEQNSSLGYLAALRDAGVTMVRIPSCGHFPMYSNPPAMWSAIAGFVDAMKEDGPSVRDLSLAGPIGRLRHIPTSALCSAHPDVMPLPPTIRRLTGVGQIAGPAYTVRTEGGQNAAIHRAVARATPGDLLVVDANGDAECGHFGDILATACRRAGIAGLVIDGAVRDAAAIEAIGFAIFGRGKCPCAPGKTHPGSIGGVITCAGVTVHPGDIIVADSDGVVVVPCERAAAAANQAEQVLKREQAVLSQLERGMTTCEIFGIPV